MGFVAGRVKTMACPECGHEFDPNAVKPLAMIPCPKCGKSVQTPAQFGKFLLKKRLGIGPSGVVFEAFDEQLHRTVALKILKSGGEDEKMALQFMREARTLASLNHQNIVRIYDMGEFKDQHYIEMEVVTGGSVKDYLSAGTHADEMEIIDLAISVADGLNVAKQAKLVHTNIEPGTILLDEKKQPKLIDFGFGYYLNDLEEGARSDSFIYIAPEVVRGGRLSFRSDMYNLGATMFHLLAGRPPFTGNTLKEIKEARFSGTRHKLSAYRSDLNPKTEELVKRLMSLDPDQRYPSYEELIEALFEARESRPAPTPAGARETAALAEATFISDYSGQAPVSRSTRSGTGTGAGAGAGRVRAKKPTNPLMFIIPGVAAAVGLVILGIVMIGSRGSPPPVDPPKYADNQDGEGGGVDSQGAVEDGGAEGGAINDSAANSGDREQDRPDGATTNVIRPLDADKNQKLASSSIANTPADLAADQQPLTFYWPMDGNVRDEGGNSYHGINRGKVTYIKPGHVGSGMLSLSGSEYISIPSNIDFPDRINKITLATWINLPDQGEQKAWAGIITKGDTSWRLGITDKTNGQLHFAISATEDDRIDTKGTYNDGKWHHVAGVYDGKNLRIYIDGKLENSRERPNVSINQNNQDICIGNNSEHLDRQLVGQIDEARVYIDKALGADEIQKLFKPPAPPSDAPDLVLADDPAFKLVYDLNLKKLRASPRYDKDRSETLKGAFDRIAYLLELEDANGNSQYMYVSMDAFTDDLKKIKIPTVGSGARFQIPVTAMNIQTDVEGITTGKGLSGGRLEFWPDNYTANNSAKVPGASDKVYDFGDKPSNPRSGYGSMQIHNADAKQTLFAINKWKAGNNADLGIGNSTGKTRDWTFTGSAKNYPTKRLRIFVRMK